MQIFTSLTTQSIYLCMYVKLKVQFKNTIFHNRHTQPEVEHSAPVLAFPEFLYYIAGQRTCPDHPPRSRQLHPCLCKHPSHSKQKYQSVLNTVRELNSQISWVSFCTHRLRYSYVPYNYIYKLHDTVYYKCTI